MWKAVEDKVNKVKMAKIKGERTEERKIQREKKKEFRKLTVEE